MGALPSAGSWVAPRCSQRSSARSLSSVMILRFLSTSTRRGCTRPTIGRAFWMLRAKTMALTIEHTRTDGASTDVASGHYAMCESCLSERTHFGGGGLYGWGLAFLIAPCGALRFVHGVPTPRDDLCRNEAAQRQLSAL